MKQRDVEHTKSSSVATVADTTATGSSDTDNSSSSESRPGYGSDRSDLSDEELQALDDLDDDFHESLMSDTNGIDEEYSNAASNRSAPINLASLAALLIAMVLLH